MRLILAVIILASAVGCGNTGRPLVLEAYITPAPADAEYDDTVTIGCSDPTADERHMDGAQVWIVDGKLGCIMRKELGPEEYKKRGNEYQPYDSMGFVSISTSALSLSGFETVGDWMAAQNEELCTPDCGKDDAVDFDPKKTQSMKEFMAGLKVEDPS